MSFFQNSNQDTPVDDLVSLSMYKAIVWLSIIIFILFTVFIKYFASTVFNPDFIEKYNLFLTWLANQYFIF